MLIKETNNIDEINNFFMNNYLSKMEIFVKLMRRVSVREELRRFQGSTCDTITRRLIEDRDTILELTTNNEELQTEINCMNDSRDFQYAESIYSGQSHVMSQPVSFTTFSRPCRNAKPFYGNAKPQRYVRQAFGTRMEYLETFFENPTASSSTPFPGWINPWISTVSEHTSPHVLSESQTPKHCCGSEMPVKTVQSRNSIVPGEGRIFKELWSRPTATADFGSSLLQNHLNRQHLLVER